MTKNKQNKFSTEQLCVMKNMTLDELAEILGAVQENPGAKSSKIIYNPVSDKETTHQADKPGGTFQERINEVRTYFKKRCTKHKCNDDNSVCFTCPYPLFAKEVLYVINALPDATVSLHSVACNDLEGIHNAHIEIVAKRIPPEKSSEANSGDLQESDVIVYSARCVIKGKAIEMTSVECGRDYDEIKPRNKRNGEDEIFFYLPCTRKFRQYYLAGKECDSMDVAVYGSIDKETGLLDTPIFEKEKRSAMLQFVCKTYKTEREINTDDRDLGTKDVDVSDTGEIEAGGDVTYGAGGVNDNPLTWFCVELYVNGGDSLILKLADGREHLLVGFDKTAKTQKIKVESV